MGIYVYTLRKKTVKLLLPQKVDAHLLAYAYKDWWSWAYDDEEERRRNFIRNNAARHAENAFNAMVSPYVVVGDPGESLQGREVYRDLKSPIWYDTDGITATIVGFVHEIPRGKRVQRRVLPYSPWEPSIKTIDGQCLPVLMRRIIGDDGYVTWESRADESRTPTSV
jgi:hypothetical protein